MERNVKHIYCDTGFEKSKTLQFTKIHPVNLPSTEEIQQKLWQSCNIFEKETTDIVEKYYSETKRQQYFRWFLRYSIQNKIKIILLKFN